MLKKALVSNDAIYNAVFSPEILLSLCEIMTNHTHTYLVTLLRIHDISPIYRLRIPAFMIRAHRQSLLSEFFVGYVAFSFISARAVYEQVRIATLRYI